MSLPWPAWSEDTWRKKLRMSEAPEAAQTDIDRAKAARKRLRETIKKLPPKPPPAPKS